MTYIRSLIYLGFLGLSVALVSVPILLLGKLAPYWVIGNLGKTWAGWNLAALRAICGLRMRITGLENLPGTPAIILCKHQSAWETLALRAVLPIKQTWVLKDDLMRIPVFGWALSRYRPIAINRDAGHRAIKQLLAQGARAIDDGNSIIIFPEGTRVALGERRRYGIGGALLAERTGVPIVPIAHNAGLFWARRRVEKYPGTVDLVIGPAIVAGGRTAVELGREAELWIESTVARLPRVR